MVLPLVTMECRVATEPELKFGNSGTPYIKFRAVSSSRKQDESGKWVDDKTTWLGVTAFKNLAENVSESVEKGDLVLVTGRLQQEDWKDQNGQDRTTYTVLADTIGPSLQFRKTPHGASRQQPAAQQAGPQDSPWDTPGVVQGSVTQAHDDPPF